MLLNFIWIGKTRNPHWLALEQDYLSRLEHFVSVRTHVVREAKSKPLEAHRQEAQGIQKQIRSGAYTILMDERGTMLTSKDLAALITRHQHEGRKELAFIVGGASGVAPQVGERADFTLSLSRMTLPHEMARTILLEQVYRAFAIIHNLPYPK